MNFRDIFFNNRQDWLSQKIDQVFFSDNIISGSIALLNEVFFFLFAFYAVVLAGMAVINSASRGRPFNKGSEVWIVVRMILGLFLILPIPLSSSTYNTAQLVAISCVKVGSRGATYVWEKALEQMRDLKPLVPPTSPKVIDFAHQLFSMSICIETQNFPKFPEPEIKQNVRDYKDRIILSADGDPAMGGITGQCGTITYLKGDDSNIAVKKILSSYIDLTNVFRRKIHQMAGEFIAASYPLRSKAPLPQAKLVPLFNDYVAGIARMASEKFKPNRTQRQIFFEESKKGGWVMAGGWAYQLASLNETVYRALDSMPTVTPPRYDWWAGNAKVWNRHKWVFALAERWWQEQQGNVQEVRDEAFTAFKEDSAFAFVDAARAKWAYEKTLVNDETLNPMDKMVSIGHTIINTAWRALAAKGAMDATIKLSQSVAEKSIFGRVANFFTGLPSGLTESAGAFAAVYTPIFYLGIFSLLSGGIMLAYILPLLPFRLWIFGVARYIVRVMMAILAAPIWALAHIDPEGEGVGRRASQGYYVLLDLLLRPLLMVIGLLAGFMIVSILAELFSMVFHIAIKNALVGSHGGLTGLIVYIVLGSTLFISLVNIAFSTISDGINFCFEVGGMRTPQGGSPERDSHMLDKETEQSSQKTEGVIKQSASGSAPSPKPMSNNQLIKPDSSK